jgi:SAM-dependent methyltransferase
MEPVAAMREVLERHLPRATALDGVAESMPLGDSAVDAVVVGQAFHWFDGPASLAEFHRVLRPGGRLGLIWNIRDRRQPLQRAIDEITEPLRGTTPAVGRGTWHTAFDRSALFSPCGEHRVAFELMLDHNTFVDRIGSVSFIAALDEPHREQVLDRVRRLASEHLEPWSYVTEIYVYERVEDFPAATRASTATLIHVSREDPDTEELRAEQLARERAERELAQDPPQEEETAQHERRADKAKYLREKLEERAESEQAVSDSDAAEDD